MGLRQRSTTKGGKSALEHWSRMAGSARRPTTPTSLAPFAPTIPERSIYPRGNGRGRALSVKRPRTQPETSPRSIRHQSKVSRRGIFCCPTATVSAKQASSISSPSLANMPARMPRRPRSRLTRTAGRNGQTVPCNLTPSSILLSMKSCWISPAEFAHEAGAVSPLHDDQILYGFALERQAA